VKILGWGNDTAAKSWRMEDPFKYLRRLGHEAYVSDEGITEKACKWADVYVLNSIVNKDGIAMLYQYQVEKGKKIVVDCDDYFQLNDDSPFKVEHEVANASDVIKITMQIADLITTTTNHLAEHLRKINPKVVVLPNYLDMERWDKPTLRNTSKTIRIGWAGSLTHLNDLKSIVKPLKRICDDFPQVRLIFIGDQRVQEEFIGYPAECMLGVPFSVWPERLSGLQLDIGLSPLLPTEFNKCKSNIKWLEYSIAEIPGVYSPTVYQHKDFEPKFGLVAETEDEWYGAIKHLINYPQRRQEIIDHSYRLMQNKYSLEKNAHKWQETYQNLFL
jgi:glycosyltransferase involved in cell wall biosynthesis